MQVWVRVGDGGDGGDLLRWLRSDPIAAHAQLAVLPAESGQSEMGVADTVQAILDSISGLGSLIVAVAAWRDARRHNRSQAPAPKVRIQCGATSVELVTDDPAEIRRMVDILVASDEGTAVEDASGS